MTAASDPWPGILGSAGLDAGQTRILVVRKGTPPVANWEALVSGGAYLILEGESEAARSLGFRSTAKRIRAVSVADSHNPRLDIVWENAVEIPVCELPAGATTFARERRTGAPLIAGFRKGAGAVLWLALAPGEKGYERFPFLLHALEDLGLSPPFRSSRLWAFFDSSYRTRADTGFLADRWARAGIHGLHVAAWHYFEPDPLRDAYLAGLIESCHERGILVYAWLELPHVSERFWTDHPEWREKTALLQDASLDWRKLMNLANRECFEEAWAGVGRLLSRFDWDGVNLAELYFESLQGFENPSRFTPMNADVRREFAARHGFDPIDLFHPSSPHRLERNPAGLRQFLEYRADLLSRIQTEWVEKLESIRSLKPGLDLVVTHIDDQFDTRMRDALGADASSALSALGPRGLTFLIEDPATIWDLGPERYAEISRKYAALGPHRDRLAIDLNIVQRYQDVYPTKQQTGTELFQLVNQAARAFPRVALYFENSIQAADVGWLASAASAASARKGAGGELAVESPWGAGVVWEGPAQVDGQVWPVQDSGTIWLPPGLHIVRHASQAPGLRMTSFTGDILSAGSLAQGILFSYRSSGRAIATLDRYPTAIQVDGRQTDVKPRRTGTGAWLLLPAGNHTVRLESAAED